MSTRFGLVTAGALVVAAITPISHFALVDRSEVNITTVFVVLGLILGWVLLAVGLRYSPGGDEWDEDRQELQNWLSPVSVALLLLGAIIVSFMWKETAGLWVGGILMLLGWIGVSSSVILAGGKDFDESSAENKTMDVFATITAVAIIIIVGMMFFAIEKPPESMSPSSRIGAIWASVGIYIFAWLALWAQALRNSVL